MKELKTGFAVTGISEYKKPAVLIVTLLILTAGFSFLNGWLSRDSNLPVSTEARERYFEVKHISKPESYNDEYEYTVFTRDNKILDRGVADRCPQVSYPNISAWNGFIKLSIYYFGSGGDTCRYYDIDRGLVSGWFWFPVGECDKYVVCVDMPSSAEKLIVKSIFDDSYYREFPMSFLQGWGDVFKMEQQAPVISAEFLDGATRLRVTYTDEEGNEKTETLDLY